MKLIQERNKEIVLKDIYNIKINCYRGNGIEWAEYLFLEKPEEIEKVILEIIAVKTQFPHGRGVGARKYDQKNYFLNKDKNYFQWLKNFPYSAEYQQNYTLHSFEIKYFNDRGESHNIKIEEISPEFIKKIESINYRWQNKEFFEREWMEEDNKFSDYFNQIKSVIDAYLIDMKINRAKQNKKQKI